MKFCFNVYSRQNSPMEEDTASWLTKHGKQGNIVCRPHVWLWHNDRKIWL